MNKIDTVLFDLDGTFLDTAPDLAHALNHVLRANKQKTLPIKTIRPYASCGSQGLLGLGFNINKDHDDYPRLREEFFKAYHKYLTHSTRLFRGIPQLIKFIEQQDMNWGIVTNKPSDLATKLMAHFNFDHRPLCIIGGDHPEKRKPAPDMLFEACDIIKTSPTTCIYIGDAKRDIDAAKNAGMLSVAACYGYLQADEDPITWQADYYVKRPNEILPTLQKLLTTTSTL